MSALSVVSLAWMGIAVATAVLLLKVAAPYGRHARPGWGPTIPHRVGWIVMETVSPIALLVSVAVAGGSGWHAAFLVGLWLLHYANRAVVYPLRARWSDRRMPVLVAASAVLFNVVNGTLNGWALADPVDGSVRFWIGVGVFGLGAAVNLHSDRILLRLRGRADDGYEIPRGGLFEWVSCPNYLGEIVQWIGFAIAAWNLPALSFAVWTIANLAPRAVAHHRWYHETFDRYPAHRRALVPGIL